MDFYAFLSWVRSKSSNEREKGYLFEKGVRNFLRKSPEYGFKNVWLWSDWPEQARFGFTKKDLGIDLVAKDTCGKLWAVQCKCYSENYKLSKSDIDSFFTHSGKQPFNVRLIVTTTNNWGPNAIEALKNQSKPTKTLGPSELASASMVWGFDGPKKEPLKKLRPHQREALQACTKHFARFDRGKLIMACGTGKTFTSLKVLEHITPPGSRVLFLAPSIALIAQTLKEYAWQSTGPQRYIAVCSDTKVGKTSEGDVGDLQIPPTTAPRLIAQALKTQSSGTKRHVVFCTYQSLERIYQAQRQYGAPVFDLVICDEAHRTTGVEDSSQNDSRGNYFTRINDPHYVKAKKRLYMTATPRIYSDRTKQAARKKHGTLVHCMDDESVFGKEIYRLDFSKAIKRDLLADYRVIILNIEEDSMTRHIQNAIKETSLSWDDAVRLVGCYKALRDQGKGEQGTKLSRAVGFLQTIKASKAVAKEFEKIVKALDEYENDYYTCDSLHIDGADSSIEKNTKLDWLKQDAGHTERGEKICRVLFNAKCLTEGIDVPGLDAVMFLHPRKSQVDVVQAVGRAIRKQKGKKYGYVILPIVVPPNNPEVLEDNKTYKAVWQVVNALRSHDSEFDAMVNNLNLNKERPHKIQCVGIGFGAEESSTGVVDFSAKKNLKNLKEIETKVYAKIVEKCGSRNFEARWAAGVGEDYLKLVSRIEGLVLKNPDLTQCFEQYHSVLKSIINTQVSKKEATHILAEHMMTHKAFDLFFPHFSKKNPVAKALGVVSSKLEQYGLMRGMGDQVEKVCDGVKNRLKGIDSHEGKQQVVKEFYENFFKAVRSKEAQRDGVCYTPVPLVDFVLQSADGILKKHFKKGLTKRHVHIMEPFVGTGTFLSRLLAREDLINEEDLHRKYTKELHAKDKHLLAYYVASINTEMAYQSRMAQSRGGGGGVNVCAGHGDKYVPFSGIALTDTFNIEAGSLKEASAGTCDKAYTLQQEHMQKIKQQNSMPIHVILGNPPYSVGQRSENDANKNIQHLHWNKRIADTYAANSNATLKKSLYDTYVKAFRWASDRLGDGGGVIGFVHNANVFQAQSFSGFRKSLVEELDAIYCLNLKGNLRTRGEMLKKEGQGVFEDKMIPIGISFLVKSGKKQSSSCKIYYCEIGNALTREQKLYQVKKWGSFLNAPHNIIVPDAFGDWVNKRDRSFYKYLPMGDKRGGSLRAIFALYSLGVLSARDSWVYNFNFKAVKSNVKSMIQCYNSDLENLKPSNLNTSNIDSVINKNKKQISWSHTLKQSLIRGQKGVFDKSHIVLSSYRPFTKMHWYGGNMLNHRLYKMPMLFPTAHAKNKVICIAASIQQGFSVLMTDQAPNLDFLEKCQAFPLYRFGQWGRPGGGPHKPVDNISDMALMRFKQQYGHPITKEDIFYYIYALLHSECYREKYKHNLGVSLPHVPFVPGFKLWSQKGLELGELHLNYEHQNPPNGVRILKNNAPVSLGALSANDLKLAKIKLSKCQTQLHYNDALSIVGLPVEALQYEVGGRAALKWIIDRYRLKTDKSTGIVSDPNTYSQDPAYVLKLVLSMVQVSVRTQQIIKSLPAIDFDALQTPAAA